MPTTAPIEVLKSSMLFSGVSDEQAKAVARRCQIRRTAKGELLFSQGDDSDSLYIVIEGSVIVSLLSEAGREIIFHIAREGESIGELALLDAEPRSATCTVRDPGALLVLRRSDFLSLLEEPEIARSILAVLCGVIRSSNARSEFLALRPLRARVAHVLLANAEGGPPGRVKLTQRELALMCGAARPRVNRVLKAFEAEEIITKDGRVTVLSDPDGLESVALEEGDE
ncbi:MAG: Crp/Fnr family transcriptional regulator [Pseudomonadota bacterium]